MHTLYEQYKNAYPKLSFDAADDKSSSYGWRGNGYGWIRDPSEWKTDSIYPSIENPEDEGDGATADSEEELEIVKAQTVGQVGSSYGERGSGISTQGDVQDFYKLRDYHCETQTLFEDPQFPADHSSLSFSGRSSKYDGITWKRPHQICDDPRLFVEGFSRFDVQQGELGDCWLLAAVANLTLHHNLFFQIVPADQSFDEQYAGIFHFRFWQYGRWIDVVIDDLLPTRYGELVFLSSSEKNEFWSALLEKAYAKLHGSYEAIEGGNTCEAMEDFTGGVSEMYVTEEAPPNLFKIIKNAYERGSLIGLAIEPDPHIVEAKTPQGLVKGHAYSCTKVVYLNISTPRVSGKIALLRIRNPWGNDTEWNGPWSDQSPEWSLIPEDEKEHIGLNFDNDGEFWMSFQDVLKYFNRVELCNLNPDSLEEGEAPKRWELSMYEGAWVQGVTAGGCRNYLDTFVRNPQYNITLTEPDEDDDKCTVIVSLTQKNRRKLKNVGADHLTIGFVLYYIHDPDRAPRPLDKNYFRHNRIVGKSPTFVNLREVTCRFTVPPGTYCIIPSTFEPDEEGEFLLRVFSENKNNLVENDQPIGIIEQPPAKEKVQDIPRNNPVFDLFWKYAGGREEIGWSDLQSILMAEVNHDYQQFGKQNMRPVEGAQQTNVDPENLLKNLLSLLCGAFCKDTPLADLIPKPEEVPLTNQDSPVSRSKGFSNDVCRSLVALLDKNRSGKLGFDEFVILWQDLNHWTSVFQKFDKDNSNNLSGSELRDAMNSAGFTVNAHTLNMIMHRYGNKNNALDFDDFLICIIKIKHMIETFKEKDPDNTNEAIFSMEEFIDLTLYS